MPPQPAAASRPQRPTLQRNVRVLLKAVIQNGSVLRHQGQLLWSRDETVEIDVLGISGDTTGMLGECRWQKVPLTSRDVLELQRKISFVPEPAAQVRLLFWSRTGAVEPGFPARAYSVADVVD
jgi:hypothetical protein